LISFVVETLRKIPSTHVLFFYCKDSDSNRDSFSAIARALIGQVVIQEPSLLAYIFRESSNSGERPPRAIKPLQKLLDISLRSMSNIYVVIDGLDECIPREKNIIVSWFKNIATVLRDDNIRFRCLISSQSDQDTHKSFKGIPSIYVGGDDLLQDVQTFCKVEGIKFQKKFGLSDDEINQIVKRVSSEADSMFSVWVIPHR
jgi:hypothetical protein